MELTSEQKQAVEQQKLNCPFCQIIAGKIPSKKVYEDERILAILDINPATPGHVLVMPKEHYPIMPLIPEEAFIHLFARTREISHYLKTAMLTTNMTQFIANGQAAGQQTQHFMVHIVPSDGILKNFVFPAKQHEQEALAQAHSLLANNLPIMMRKRSSLFPLTQPTAMQSHTSSDLAQLISEHPELREAIINNPAGVLAGIEENPSLKPLFEGVDLEELGRQLAKTNAEPSSEPVQLSTLTPTAVAQNPEPPLTSQSPPVVSPQTDVPSAVRMSDAELVAFLDEKETLKEYLLNDQDTLLIAMQEQPRLIAFFAGTSPQEVRDRYLYADQKRPRRFGGGQ